MNQDPDFSNSRRKLLAGAGATLAMAATAPTMAAGGHHHHHDSLDNGVVEASLHCLKTGQACLNHCMGEFKAGNAEMADCAASVQEMLAMCATMSQMASLESRHVKKVADACIAVCDDCIEACNRHAKKHQVCKDCAQACKDCIKEMKKVA